MESLKNNGSKKSIWNYVSSYREWFSRKNFVIGLVVVGVMVIGLKLLTMSYAAESSIFNVVSYGADPTGQRDSTLAIRNTISAAEATSTSKQLPTVYFPGGRYILNDPDARYADFKIDTPVNVTGAGADITTIVEMVGTNKYPASQLFQGLNRGKTVFIFGGTANGFTFSGLTIDSRTYNAGNTLDNWGNNSTIENSTFLGGYNGTGQVADNNVDDFTMRDVHICSRDLKTNSEYGYATGNVIKNVTLYGQGVGGNDDLDLTCQQNLTVSNVTDTGWGMALYTASNVTITNYNYTPWNFETYNTGVLLSSLPTSTNQPTLTPNIGCSTFGCNFGYIITAGMNVTINNFTTTGAGGGLYGHGEMGSTTKLNLPSENVTINNEQMRQSGFELTIRDANNTVINDSTIDKIHIGPLQALGISVNNSKIGEVNCQAGTIISGLQNISCTTNN